MDDFLKSSNDTFFDGRGGAYWKKRTLAIPLLVAVLLVQGAYAARPQPQPYPAVILPGFRQTTTNWQSKFVHVEVSLRYADGTQLTPYLRDIFTDFNYSAIGPSVDHVFRPHGPNDRAPLSEPVMAWLKTKAGALHPASDVRSIRFCWRTVTNDVRGPSSSDGPCDPLREVNFG